MEWLWHWLLKDAYWYCFTFFLLSLAVEELFAPRRRWHNRDDQIVYGQRKDSPANIHSGRSRSSKPKRKDPPANRPLTPLLR